jgi:hypothetical protein
MPARELFGPELFARFGFEALKMNCLRRRIRGAHLTRDLFAERHARDEMRAASRRM